MPKENREPESAVAYIEKCINILLYNWLKLKDVKKIQSRCSYRTKKCGDGQYISSSAKPNDATTKSKQRVESLPDFIEWLHDKEPRHVAQALGIHNDEDGPLITVIEI